MIYRFDSLGSTNDEAQDQKYSHGDIVVAERQSAGRGQRGNKWLSGQGLNLTLSVVIEPEDIEVRSQFLVLQASALAICDVLEGYGLTPKIKWTNDIYIGDEKIVGILIENKLSGSMLKRSVVGVGLNVNQLQFDPSLPNPTSMALTAAKVFDRDEVLAALERAMRRRFDELSSEGHVSIADDYHEHIYRLGEAHSFRLPSGAVQRGEICGVRPTGELIIDWLDGAKGEYLFGGVDFIIEKRKR